MIEGWLDDEYLVLFDDEEAQTATERYEMNRWLPGFRIIGLRGWDDFIVRDSNLRNFTMPTVPVDAKHLAPFHLPVEFDLETDPRHSGKVKWYVKPVVFGGDVGPGGNLTWVTHDQHVQLVVWWNDLYQDIKCRGGSI